MGGIDRMKIRLPLHVWAEQLETVMANRMYKPHCAELKIEQFQTWRKLIDEYQYLSDDIHKQGGVVSDIPPPKKVVAKTAIALKNLERFKFIERG